MIKLSFVIPCYRSQDTIEKVIHEIVETVQQREGYDYEIIAVNDASPDGVYNVLLENAHRNEKVKLVNLAKNFGKHAAVMAGYSFVSGNYIVNLDDDCQCPVYELWKLVDPIERDECDIATASYYSKKESIIKRLGSDINLWMSSIMLDKPKELRFENFSVMKRFVSDEVLAYKNPYPYLEGLCLRVTDRVRTVQMENRERADGNASGFTFWKSVALFMNGLTAFSVKPLRMATLVGMAFAMLGFVYGMYVVARKIVCPDIPMGYSSLMAMLVFSSGLIMLMLGMIGEYLGRIYICINDSPQYVVKETINLK